MSKDKTTLLIVLRPARGRLRDKAPAQASNVSEVLPEPELAERVRAYFEGQGFLIHPLVANSFSIEGPRKLFEKLFPKAELAALESTGGELTLGKLPAGIREAIEAAAFTKPPDFGPTNFS